LSFTQEETAMELKEARYILAIARHKSISKAAEALFISQPSLSKYLKI
jgi:DNA-binding transcriptional LysR family regulator